MFSKTCEPVKDMVSFGYNIGVHVTILFTILSLFFMFYISKISSRAINDEVGMNIDKYLTPVLQKQISMIPNIQSLAQNVQFDNVKKIFEEQSAAIQENNSWLFQTIVLVDIVLILFLIFTVFILRYSCGVCVPLKEIFKMNATVFTFIGIVEYLFFTQIALNYVPVEPSILVNSFIDNIKENL